MTLRFRSLFSLLVSLPLVAPPLFAQVHKEAHSKIDWQLQHSLRTGAATQRVIVTVAPGARDAIRSALAAHGDVIKADLPLVNAFAALVHSDDVAALANHPWVLSVTSDAEVDAGRDAAASIKSKGRTTYITTTLRQTLGLPKIASRTSVTGRDVVVALIDSGIQPNPDVDAARIVAFFNCIQAAPGAPTCVPAPPADDYGHGTHVAGLIGASGEASGFEFQGVAPAVKFVGLKVLDGTGKGVTSDVINAIDFVITHPESGVRVINLSLGHPIFAAAADDPLVLAVERATAAGYIVVASAGNYGVNPETGQVGYAGIISPGNAPSAITVGAAVTNDTVERQDDTVAMYSSRGPTWFDGYAKPDVVAPGDKLISDTNPSGFLFQQLPDSRKTAKNGKQFLALSGTSMAAGVTSGVVALMLDANHRNGFDADRHLSANLVKALLQYTAIPVDDAGGNPFNALTQGTGEISAAGPLSLASGIDTDAAPSAYWETNSVAGVTTLVGARNDYFTYAWAKNIVWGDNIVWGNLLFYNVPVWSQNIVWGDNVVWGNSAVAGANIVWGDNVVWGNTITWASDIIWGNGMIGIRGADDNIVWGNIADADNIVWGNLTDDNIVWGNLEDNIVWGNTFASDDNIVWGNDIVGGNNIVWGNSGVGSSQKGAK